MPKQKIENESPTNAPSEPEYEASLTAPYNRKAERPLGSKANQAQPESREDEIEKEKQYYHGGKRP